MEETYETSTISFARADLVFGTDADTILASGMGNNVVDTPLGSVETETITLFGWAACSKKISSFGYRYGDTVVLSGSKYTTEDAVIQAGAPVAGTTGESTRFLIAAPVQSGTNVKLYAVAQLEDGSILDLWSLVYSG